MIEFILYEKDIELNNLLKFLILNFFGCRENEFKVKDYNKLFLKKPGNKIYILSSENYQEVIEISKEIRKAEDWESQIIIINNNIKNNYNKLLILDIIKNDQNLEEKLKTSLHTAYKILTIKKFFTFKTNSEIYQIPYRDILYFEKNNSQNYCIMHTKNKKYIIKGTIKHLEKTLDPIIFMKIHRSYIVNINNIANFNFNENIISFGKTKIYSISREKRKFLKNKLTSNKITN